MLAVAFLSGFQQFNLDKVLMEHLYSEEIAVASGKEWRSDKEEFLQRIANRKPYSFGYCGYKLTKLFNRVCCCFKSCLRHSQKERLERRLRSIRKLDKAR